MTDTPTNPFIINLVETSYQRLSCTVCGGWTEKYCIKAENPRDVSPRIRVCETCLEAGDIDDRLMDHAEALEALAIETRALVGLLKVPTFAEWKAANEKAEAEVAEEIERERLNPVVATAFSPPPPVSDHAAADLGDEIPF